MNFSRRLQLPDCEQREWGVTGSILKNHIHKPLRNSQKYLRPHIQCTDYFPSLPILKLHSGNQRDLLWVLLKLNSAVAFLMRLALDLVRTSGPAGWLHRQEIMPDVFSCSIKLATYMKFGQTYCNLLQDNARCKVEKARRLICFCHSWTHLNIRARNTNIISNKALLFTH